MKSAQTKVCIVCGTAYARGQNSAHQWRKSRFCSQACYWQFLRRETAT